MHIIADLDTGGAEMMLYKLLANMDRQTCQSRVISLLDVGPGGEKIRKLNISVLALGMKRGVPNPVHLLRLSNWVLQLQPDVIQTWMYHSDLMGGLASRVIG